MGKVQFLFKLTPDNYEFDILNEIMQSFLIDSMIEVHLFEAVHGVFVCAALENLEGLIKMYDILLEKFDGTGRVIREIQRNAFKVIADNIDSNDIIFLQMGVGSGKSAVLKAVQNYYKNAVYMTAQNVLLDQLQATYPSLPVLKGKKRYQCYESKEGLTCAEASELMSVRNNEAVYCKLCPYLHARKTALRNEAVGVNLMSFFFLQYSDEFNAPHILLVDEAHVILAALRNLASKTFSQEEYDFDENELTSDRKVVDWMKDLIDKLETIRDAYKESGSRDDEIDSIDEHICQIGMIMNMIQEAPQNYVFSFKSQGFSKTKKFVVQPIKTPSSLLSRVLNSTKLIFTSGTLLKHHVEELACGNPSYLYYDMGMPIPKEHRIIKFSPLSVKANYNTEAKDYCIKIFEVIDGMKKELIKETEELLSDEFNLKIKPVNFKKINVVIHVTYSLQKLLEPILREKYGDRLYVNTQDNKQEVVDNFIKNGGVFLAAGCAEGLDFDYDKCRIQIIPKLPFPNLNDEMVAKRRALPDGNQWYVLETFTTLIQMTGRATRSMDDFSITYVLDPIFPRMVNEYRGYLPKYFLEAIKWR